MMRDAASDVREFNLDDEDDDGAWMLVPRCQWGRSGYCSGGRHKGCLFTKGPAHIPAGYGKAEGWDDRGHVWVCQCPCHENQGYPPCPGDPSEHIASHVRDQIDDVQLNLF